jgi:putative membrane protein
VRLGTRLAAAIPVAAILLATAASAHDTAAPAALDAATWNRWSFEPGSVAALAVAALLYAVGQRRLHRRAPAVLPATAVAAFWSGLVVVAVALVSPIHTLGSALFTAHMVQHELLMVVAAPLVALGRSGLAMRAALPGVARRPLARLARRSCVRVLVRVLASPIAAAGLHAAAVIVWHVPAAFAATIADDWVHAAQHASFFGTALLFWWAVLEPKNAHADLVARLGAVFATGVVGAVVGALLTVAPTPWYPVYAYTTAAFGLTPLEDQQLGGLVMWVPAGLAYVAAGLALAARALRTPSARAVALQEAWR